MILLAAFLVLPSDAAILRAEAAQNEVSACGVCGSDIHMWKAEKG